jgi:energy-coupling factor transporter ATP-binding protein EcfA2
MTETSGAKLANPKHLRMMIYGPPGCGKTTFAASFPGAVVLDCERGSLYVDCRRIEVGSWSAFREGVRSVVGSQGKPNRAEMVVVDSLDRLRDLAIAELGTPKNIRDWGRINGEIRTQINILMNLPDTGCILTSWARSVHLDPAGTPYPLGAEPPREAPRATYPSASGAAWSHAERWVDTVLFVTPYRIMGPGRDWYHKDRTGKIRQCELGYDAFRRLFLPAKEVVQ